MNAPWWLLLTVFSPIVAGVWFIIFETWIRPRDPKPDDRPRLIEPAGPNERPFR